MKRTDRPRARRRTGMTLSETHRPGAHALRLGESDDEPVYMYNLRARTRDPAEVRAASRDEMPELPEYMVSRIRHARDEGAADEPANAHGKGARTKGGSAQSRIPVPADRFAPLPEAEQPSVNGKAVRSGSKPAQSRLSTDKPAPLPADKELPRAKSASKASTPKPSRPRPAAKGRKAAASGDDLPDLPDNVLSDMRTARADVTSADDSAQLLVPGGAYAAPLPIVESERTFGMNGGDIAQALSGARPRGISAQLARDLHLALASPMDVDWGELAYDYCEVQAIRALARLILGPERALAGCMAEMQARRAIAQACALEDVMQAAKDVLGSAAFTNHDGMQGADIYVWEQMMGETGVLRDSLYAIAARDRAESVNVRNVCDRLLVPGMARSLNLNAFRYMLCDMYVDAYRAQGGTAVVPDADCVMEWFERALPALRTLARWRAVMRGAVRKDLGEAVDGAEL